MNTDLQLIISIEPQQWYESLIYAYYILVRLEHIAICGHSSSHCYPPMCICLYLWHNWIEAARDQSYTYSYARLVPQLTYNIHRICSLSGASFSMLYTPVHYIYLYYVGQNNDLGTHAGPIHQHGGSRIMLLLYLLIFKMSTQTCV
jgi:hypothetical protein